MRKSRYLCPPEVGTKGPAMSVCMTRPAYDGTYLELGCGRRGEFAAAHAWLGPILALRSAGGASAATSGRAQRRLSPACSQRCMYSAAC
eukprot:2293153-Pleurochrysis_carterae.AAC.4